MNKDLFEEYIQQVEASKKEKVFAWSTAIGLQAVDGLKPSDYLIHTAIQNIEGNHTIDEVQELIHRYYENNPSIHQEDRTEEADKVSARIVSILSENAFSFNANEYVAIHRQLFEDIYSCAGKIRNYNITKKEWILDGATILYGSASQLRETLEYDLKAERNFSYKGLSMDDTIRQLALFVSRLWQIHAFGEGNTRTTAIFFIKYLRMIGFHVGNEIFAEHSWYFRNCLVRANYTNIHENIYETTEYLEEFIKCLLLNEKGDFHNRNLHIRLSEDLKNANIIREKVDIEEKKVDIEEEKVDIGIQSRVICEDILVSTSMKFTPKTKQHIKTLFTTFKREFIFGRSDVMNVLNMKKSGAYNLIVKMHDAGLIKPVSGYGKGKYKFIEL
ncbi:MAG: Fic family protein [Eubacteriales bacterium]